MRILTRYLLRLHVAPFLFAVTGLTLLLLLDQVSKRFEGLIGKGLHWSIIAEVFVYSIPFILAQTLPMAVLIAVLYTFNRLTSDHEVTAIKAAGIPITRVIAPLLLAATVLAGAMTWFNNTILPESNHHLQVLLTGIGRKKPTFDLREYAINEVLPSRLYVQPGRIYRDSNRLEPVTIFDERDGPRSRTIFADRARMGFTPDGSDLVLVLDSGTVHERNEEREQDFRRTRFTRLVMRVPDVANDLERDTAGFRSDREMSIPEMQVKVDEGRERADRALASGHDYAVALTQRLTGATSSLESSARPPPNGEAPAGVQRPGDTVPATDHRTAARDSLATLADTLRAEAERFAERYTHPLDASAQFKTYVDRYESGEGQISQYAVEIHKKYTIPAACIVFVLIGAPIAIRFPRAGVALVVGVSLAFFAAYYVSLVGGEELADNRIISPFWAMWAPNVLFGVLGLAALWQALRMHR